MYLFLLVFGAVLTAAGVLLAASGLSVHDHAFDMSIVTPGIVAAVGGLALIGLGLALRVLQRIEQSLAARPMPRAVRPGETAEPAPILERPDNETRIPLPPKAAARPHAALGAAAPLATAPEKLVEKPSRRFAEKSLVARMESGSDETDLSLSSMVPSSVDETVDQFDKLRAARRKNGGTPGRIAPRLDLGTRSPLTSDRPKGPAFETLWPKGSRPMQAAQSASAEVVAAPTVAVTPAHEPPAEEEQIDETRAAALPAMDAAEVSILKSGVVDGMAYTLYSDGSIEADLPQGTLRFGSIAELRNHIEQSA
jgi:hypothetical protein